MPLLQANKNSTWPSQHCWNLITLQWCKYTNMVIVHCTLNKQTWMIPHFDQRVTADAKMYHTWLYDKCTIIYDHICTQFWRSVSASGHGNMILNKLPRPTRVRSRRPQCLCMLVPFLWFKRCTLNLIVKCIKSDVSEALCSLQTSVLCETRFHDWIGI